MTAAQVLNTFGMILPHIGLCLKIKKGLTTAQAQKTIE